MAVPRLRLERLKLGLKRRTLGLMRDRQPSWVDKAARTGVAPAAKAAKTGAAPTAKAAPTGVANDKVIPRQTPQYQRKRVA